MKYKILDFFAMLMGTTLENVVKTEPLETIEQIRSKVRVSIDDELKSFFSSQTRLMETNTDRANRIGGAERAFGYTDGFIDSMSELKVFLSKHLPK